MNLKGLLGIRDCQGSHSPEATSGFPVHDRITNYLGVYMASNYKCLQVLAKTCLFLPSGLATTMLSQKLFPVG